MTNVAKVARGLAAYNAFIYYVFADPKKKKYRRRKKNLGKREHHVKLESKFFDILRRVRDRIFTGAQRNSNHAMEIPIRSMYMSSHLTSENFQDAHKIGTNFVEGDLIRY